MADKDKQAQEEPVLGQEHAPNPNAAAYVLQETSAVLPAFMGNKVPADRFQEEALRGSDEDDGGGVDAHPEENQPPMGIGPDDELPDTTGRKVPGRLREKKGKKK